MYTFLPRSCGTRGVDEGFTAVTVSRGCRCSSDTAGYMLGSIGPELQLASLGRERRGRDWQCFPMTES